MKVFIRFIGIGFLLLNSGIITDFRVHLNARWNVRPKIGHRPRCCGCSPKNDFLLNYGYYRKSDFLPNS
jgi:hypothetical protein